MPPHSPEEVESLFRGPPTYDEANEPPQEEFEIEDPDSAEVQAGPVTWFTKMSTFGKSNIFIPVRHVIDPIAHSWHAASMWTDRLIGRWVNPLLAKRLMFMFFTSCVIGSVYYFHSDALLTNGLVHLDHEMLKRSLREAIDVDSLQERMHFFGEMPHYAGSVGDSSTRKYVLDTLESASLRSKLDRHDIFISHGGDDLLEIKSANGDVIHTSNLIEGQAIENPSMSQQQPRSQMALSLPGDEERQIIYVNKGSRFDLDKLRVSNIDIRDSIVLVKYGIEEPGVVALRLEEFGARGCLFFSEKSSQFSSWPEGPDYPSNAIQQGSLGVSYLYPGDILSPGWPSSMQLQTSLDGAKIAHIPVAAISWDDAKPLFESLRGYGIQTPEWHNNGAPDVPEIWTGPSENKVHLKISPAIEERHQIANVIGSIKGHESSSEAIIVGARLDAMCYGSSQLSGLAVLLEVAKAYATVRYDVQWQPLRSILFVAWDGTSQNYAGSTEWVESVSESLAKEGIAYIDLDVGISGPNFIMQGNPVLDFQDMLKGVRLNDSFSLWDAIDFDDSLFPIPGYGNHLAFEAHTGVPTIKMGFNGYPVPKDSCFDSIEWMNKFGDPNFERHKALADITSDILLELSDGPLIPYDFRHVGSEIERYLDDLYRETDAMIGPQNPDFEAVVSSINNAKVGAKELANAGNFYHTTQQQWLDYANRNKDSSGKLVENPPVSGLRLFWNGRISHVCKAFLDTNGINDRNWYKNHIFGPMKTSYEGEKLSGTFPAVRDALRSGNGKLAASNLDDAMAHVVKAAKYLESMI